MTALQTADRKQTAAFWLIAILASAHFALAYALTLPIQWTMASFAHAQIPFPYRRRVLIQYLYRAILHLGPTVSLGRATITLNTLTEILLAFASVLLAVFAARLLLARVLGPHSSRCSHCSGPRPYFSTPTSSKFASTPNGRSI